MIVMIECDVHGCRSKAIRIDVINNENNDNINLCSHHTIDDYVRRIGYHIKYYTKYRSDFKQYINKYAPDVILKEEEHLAEKPLDFENTQTNIPTKQEQNMEQILENIKIRPQRYFRPYRPRSKKAIDNYNTNIIPIPKEKKDAFLKRWNINF